MLKTTLIAAAALSFLALGATQASAGSYGHGWGHGWNYSWNHGGGYNHRRSHRNYSWNRPRCHYVNRPIKIKLWNHHSYRYYFKTVYRDVEVCD
jgi:hypothetical protein